VPSQWTDFIARKGTVDARTTRLGCLRAGSTLNALILEGGNLYIRGGTGRTDSTNTKGNALINYSDIEATANRTGPGRTTS
jgi:hypothetical protein